MANIFKNKFKSTIIDYELLKKTKNVENILNLTISKCYSICTVGYHWATGKFILLIVSKHFCTYMYLSK